MQSYVISSLVKPKHFMTTLVKVNMLTIKLVQAFFAPPSKLDEGNMFTKRKIFMSGLVHSFEVALVD